MVYVIIILVIILFYIVITKNSFVALLNKVNEGFSTMDVYLKKRWDLIPNLVNTIKGYAKHEKDILENITKLRSGNYNDLTDEEKVSKNQELTKEIQKLMVVVENYPELKANENFLSLQKDLKSLEDDISNARKYYNATVRKYNNKVEMIPSNFVAMIFSYKTKKMFEITDEERETVKVEF